MTPRYHQRVAVGAAALLALLVLLSVTIFDLGSRETWIEVAVWGIGVVLSLIAVSWLVRAVSPNSPPGLRMLATVLILVVPTVAILIVALFWALAQSGGRLLPE